MTELGQQIIAAIRARAEANPEYIYSPGDKGFQEGQTCAYVLDGEPSCLIGCALWDLGIIGPELETDPGTSPDDDEQKINESGIGELASYLDLGISIAEIDWLSTAQSRQDRGSTWAHAVKMADIYGTGALA